MTMISYAQNAEDVLLRRAFGSQPEGFYIDIGANDPTLGSVTRHFYDRGWRGINCEPGGIYHELKQARPRDLCLQLAASNVEGERAFYEITSSPGLSTLDATLAEGYRREGQTCQVRSIRVCTLSSICRAHVHGPIDFLTIDAEGHEREVIEGGDWNRYRPRVLLVESNHPERWETILLHANYLFAFFDGINRFYVRGEESQLLASLRQPASCIDDYFPLRFPPHVAEGGKLFLAALDAGVGPRAFRVGLNLACWLHHRATEARHLKAAAQVWFRSWLASPRTAEGGIGPS